MKDLDQSGGFEPQTSQPDRLTTTFPIFVYICPNFREKLLLFYFLQNNIKCDTLKLSSLPFNFLHVGLLYLIHYTYYIIFSSITMDISIMNLEKSGKVNKTDCFCTHLSKLGQICESVKFIKFLLLLYFEFELKQSLSDISVGYVLMPDLLQFM